MCEMCEKGCKWVKLGENALSFIFSFRIPVRRSVKGATEYVSIWLHNPCFLSVPMEGRNQPIKEWMWWMCEMCEKGCKWVKLGENALSPMWKKHQNLLSNKNDAQSIHGGGVATGPCLFCDTGGGGGG